MNIGIGKFLREGTTQASIESGFRRLSAAISAGFQREHREDGTHSDVTTTGLTNSGAFVTNGWQATATLSGSYNDVIVNDTTTVLEVRPGGAVTITGITGGSTGRRVVIINSVISVDDVTLALDDTGSVSANRFCGNAAIGGDTIVVTPGRAVEVIYRSDPAGGRNAGWHVMVKA